MVGVMDENNKDEVVVNNIYQSAEVKNFYNPNVNYYSDSYFDN